MFFFSWKIFFFFFLLEGNFFLFLLFFSALSANFTRKFLLFFQVFIFLRNFSNYFLFLLENFSTDYFFSVVYTFLLVSHRAIFFRCSARIQQNSTIDRSRKSVRKYSKIFISLKTQPTTFFEGFNPRRRGRWMSQRSWYCSTIDQKKNTDQQNTENVNEAQEPGKKSKRNIRKRNFRICSPLSRAHTALILSARLYMKKFLIFFSFFLTSSLPYGECCEVSKLRCWAFFPALSQRTSTHRRKEISTLKSMKYPRGESGTMSIREKKTFPLLRILEYYIMLKLNRKKVVQMRERGESGRAAREWKQRKSRENFASLHSKRKISETLNRRNKLRWGDALSYLN